MKINNTNIQNARYITGNIDQILEEHADEVGVIFGHSDNLSDICGYFVFVMGFGTTPGHLRTTCDWQFWCSTQVFWPTSWVECVGEIVVYL